MSNKVKEKSDIVAPLIAGIAAALSAASVGFNLGWPTPSLSKLLADDSEIPITSDQGSWIVSFFLIGSLIGGITSPVIVDRFGRKMCLLISAIPQISSCTIIGLAPSYWWLNFARLIGGFSSGISTSIIPIYLGEIAVDRIRGGLTVALNILMNAAILITYCIGPWVSRAALAGLGGGLSLLFALTFVWMPESPYFLIMKKKPDRAEKSLTWLTRKESTSQELEMIEKNVEFDQKNAGTMKDLVMVPGNRKALFILVALIVGQQLSGISGILAYSNLIMEASGSTLDSNISVIIIGTVQLLSGIPTVLLIDLAGRRPLLLSSAGGAILFLVGEALYFQLQALGNDVSWISWLPVTSMVGFIIFYTIGLGCIPHVILSEIFPCNVKALAAMACTTSGSVAGILSTKMYQFVADAYGIHVSFWGFAVIVLCFGTLFYFILPETKQRSLRSIQEEFHKTTESTTQLKDSNNV